MKYAIYTNDFKQPSIEFLPENDVEREAFAILNNYGLALEEYYSNLIEIVLELQSTRRFRHDAVDANNPAIPTDIRELKGKLDQAQQFFSANKKLSDHVCHSYDQMLNASLEIFHGFKRNDDNHFSMRFSPQYVNDLSLTSVQLKNCLEWLNLTIPGGVFDSKKIHEIMMNYGAARLLADADGEYDAGFDDDFYANSESESETEYELETESDEENDFRVENRSLSNMQDDSELEKAWEETETNEQVKQFTDFVQDEAVKQVVTQMNNLSVDETKTDKDTEKDPEKVFQDVYKKFSKHSFFGLSVNNAMETSVPTAEEADKALQTARKDASFTTAVQNNLKNALGVRRANNTTGSCDLMIPRSRL